MGAIMYGLVLGNSTLVATFFRWPIITSAAVGCSLIGSQVDSVVAPVTNFAKECIEYVNPVIP
jgi:pheromone shutdown protein TraB